MCRAPGREPTSSLALQDTALATCTYPVCRNNPGFFFPELVDVLIICLFSLTPGYVLPWESSGEGWEYPSSFAPPLQVAIEASNGASDYGNKFGEPVLSGQEEFSLRKCHVQFLLFISLICFFHDIINSQNLIFFLNTLPD